jgi:hypothetical protein
MGFVVNNKYCIGDLVYLKTDKEQSPRIVFCIKVTQTDVLYEVACGTLTSAHYDFELSKEPNIVLTSTN